MACLCMDLDLLLAGAAVVVEDQLVAAPGPDLPDVVLAVAVRLGRLVNAVPDRTDHVGTIDVAVLEGHEHLVVDFGKKEAAAAPSRP